jgi:hypothetical protein
MAFLPGVPNWDCPDLDLDLPDEKPEYDAAQVADAISSIENTFEAMTRCAVQTPNGDTVSIAIVSPNHVAGKFYGPQTQLVLEAARLWHDHLRAVDNPAISTEAPPTAVATKTVYRVVVSVEGDMKDDDYFVPYDRRKDAFIFAATLDPETYDEIDVVEDVTPAYTVSCGPVLENDGDVF